MDEPIANPQAQSSLAAVARALDAVGVAYMVIGGQAVLVYGEPRLTRDIDITLGASPDRLPEILALARDQGWQVLIEDDVAAFVRRTWVLPCGLPAGLRLDLIFSASPYEQVALGRAAIVHTPDGPVRFATPEDLVIHKLFAGRARDLEDIAGLLQRGVSLDLPYLRNWLAEFDAASDSNLQYEFEHLLRETGRA